MRRRSFLRAGAGGVLSLGALGTAGCSGIPVIGSGGSYTKWLHEPGEITATDHYTVRVMKPKNIISNDDVFDDDGVTSLEDRYDQRLDPTGVDADEIDRVVETNAGTVYTGGFSAGDVRSELEENDFDEDDDLNGFTTFSTPDESRAWAIGSNALVQTQGLSEPAPDVAASVVEVGSGNANRYVAESEAMGLLTNKLRNGFTLLAYTFDEREEDNAEQGVFENSTGVGVSGTRNGDTVNLKYVVAFAAADDVDVSDIEDWVDAQEDGTFEDLDDVSTNKSGRAGVVKGKMDADDTTLFG